MRQKNLICDHAANVGDKDAVFAYRRLVEIKFVLIAKNWSNTVAIGIEKYRAKVNKLLAQHSHACLQADLESKALADIESKQLEVLEAQQLVQNVAEQIQASAHNQIASVVSRCLQAVFGEDCYEFKIKFEKLRGKTEARLVFVRDDHELSPTDAAGGGVLDLASMALRLAALVLARPRRRKLLLLDEPFKHLSSNYRPMVKTMLETLCKDLGLQIIMVTHAPELVVGKVIEIG